MITGKLFKKIDDRVTVLFEPHTAAMIGLVAKGDILMILFSVPTETFVLTKNGKVAAIVSNQFHEHCICIS